MKKYYHACSQGLEKSVIFSDDLDFISGVNDIAIALQKFDVKVVCYCLMSNHFHFILYGEKQDCYEFAIEYKRRCSIRLRLGRMEVNALQNLVVDANEIGDMEYLENAISYVLRNPLAARINVMPYHYRWSSARVYFRGTCKPKGISVGDLAERKRHRILKTKIDISDNYIIDEEGMILPECFVDATIVENLFRHPSRLLFALAKKVETEVEMKFGIAERVSYADSELKSLLNELILNEFGVTGLSSLTSQQKISLCSKMKRNFNASVKQISRILRIDAEIVGKLV